MRAAAWSLVGHGAGQALRLISNLVLTRLLAPELYGVVAVGYVVVTGLGMFSDLGLSASAMRSTRGDDPVYQNTGWVLQIGRGVILTILGALAGLVLGIVAKWGLFPSQSVYVEPVVPLLVAVVCMQSLFDGFASTKAWTARRSLAFKRLTAIELCCQLSSTVVMIVWALISPSVWTLAGGGIAGAFIRTVMTHVLLPGARNRFEWDPEAFAEMIHFGKWIFFSTAISFFLISGDRLLLGTVLDARALGLYTVAFTLITAAQSAIMRIVGSAVLPALSEVYRQRPEHLRQTYYRIRAPLDIACFAAAGAIAVGGRSIVHLLYDARYAEAGWIMSVLGLTFVATPFSAFDQCLVAIGRVKYLTALNLVRLASLFVVVPIGYYAYGEQGAVAGIAISAMINVLTVMPMQARFGLLNWRREALAIPLFAGGALAAWLLQNAIRALVS